jgi:hypothetical protein
MKVGSGEIKKAKLPRDVYIRILGLLSDSSLTKPTLIEETTKSGSWKIRPKPNIRFAIAENVF